MHRWPLTLRGTGAVLLAVAAFIVAQVFDIPALLFFCTLLVCAVAAAVASLHVGRGGERVTRSFLPETGTAGEELRVRARVVGRSILPTVHGGWRDRLPAGIEGTASGTFPGLPSGLTASARGVDLEYRVTTLRRGIRPVGPLVVSTTDPFGFARRTRLIGDPVPVAVAPAVFDLAALADLPGAAGGSLHSATDARGQGADNLEPRPYVPGDSMRRIHWRASAHRGELMVRQEEQEADPEATVVFDRALARWSAEALREPGADAAFEVAVSACASAVTRLVREGYTVTVIDVDGTELVETIEAGDVAAVEALRVGFAALTAARDGSFADLVRLCAGATLGPLILVTGRIGRADAATLAPVVHHTALPVLLAVDADDDALQDARRSGWRAVGMEPADDLAAFWEVVRASTSPGPEGAVHVA